MVKNTTLGPGRPLQRRQVLKGAAALGAIGMFPAIISRRAASAGTDFGTPWAENTTG